MNKNNKVILEHSETTELPDGTKLKVTVEKFENKLFPMGEPMFVSRKIEYVNQGRGKGLRFIDYLEDINKDQIEGEVKFIVEQINQDPEKFRFQHAPK